MLSSKSGIQIRMVPILFAPFVSCPFRQGLAKLLRCPGWTLPCHSPWLCRPVCRDYRHFATILDSQWAFRVLTPPTYSQQVPAVHSAILIAVFSLTFLSWLPLWAHSPHVSTLRLTQLLVITHFLFIYSSCILFYPICTQHFCLCLAEAYLHSSSIFTHKAGSLFQKAQHSTVYMYHLTIT